VNALDQRSLVISQTQSSNGEYVSGADHVEANNYEEFVDPSLDQDDSGLFKVHPGD